MRLYSLTVRHRSDTWSPSYNGNSLLPDTGEVYAPDAVVSWNDIQPSCFAPSPPTVASSSNATSLPPASPLNHTSEFPSGEFTFETVSAKAEFMDLQDRYSLLQSTTMRPLRPATPPATPPVSTADASAPIFFASPSRAFNTPQKPARTASSSQSKQAALDEITKDTTAYKALLALETKVARFSIQKDLYERDEDIPKEVPCQWGPPSANGSTHTIPTDRAGVKKHLKEVHGVSLRPNESMTCQWSGCTESFKTQSLDRHMERNDHLHSARVHCRLCGGGNQVRGGQARNLLHPQNECEWTRAGIKLEGLKERLIKSGVFADTLVLTSKHISGTVLSLSKTRTSARANKRRKLCDD